MACWRAGASSRNSGSDGGAVESPPSSDAHELTDENNADDETWTSESLPGGGGGGAGCGDSSDTASSEVDVAAGLLRDPPNYYEAVQYLRQVRPEFSVGPVSSTTPNPTQRIAILVQYFRGQLCACSHPRYWGSESCCSEARFGFYPRDAMLARVLAMALCLSVCLCVCLSVSTPC